jgi:hypothetical protein
MTLQEMIKELELEKFAEEEMHCQGFRPNPSLYYSEEDCRNWVCDCPRCKFVRMIESLKRED